MTDDQPPELLGAGPAAARLGIDKATLKRWGDQGWIAFTRLPSGYRKYHPKDLDAALERVNQPDPEK